MMAKPSDFVRAEPWGSIFNKSEHEVVAQNVMVILKRNGDEWAELSEDEYLAERAKDNNGIKPFSELKYFRSVQKYTISEDAARAFSPCWEKV